MIQTVTDRTGPRLGRWTDRGVNTFSSGMVIGLLLALTYTV